MIAALEAIESELLTVSLGTTEISVMPFAYLHPFPLKMSSKMFIVFADLMLRSQTVFLSVEYLSKL